MIEIIRYNPDLKITWDAFNAKAKNGVFLFCRDYMDYHQHRFQDHSLLFYYNNKLVALLPLNENEQEVSSHGGLTFGGIIIGARMDIYLYLQIFELLIQYLRSNNFKSFIYKPIPFIFHNVLALEEQYALFRCNARLVSRSLSSCIDLQQKILYTKGRKWSLQQARKYHLCLKESKNYVGFMQLVEHILVNKYNVSPTHTATEIEYLAQQFPENIKLLAVYKDTEIIGGCIIYLSNKVVHLQYIATNDKGKKLHALDLLINYLIEKYKGCKNYINFGISPGSDNFGLNAGLIKNKESFGARSLPQDIYEIVS